MSCGKAKKVLVSLLCLGLSSCAVDSALSSPRSLSPSTETAESQADYSLLAGDSVLTPGQMLPITAQVELGGQPIALEVAQTRQQQALGLMYRPELPPDRGMLFPFSPPRPVSFWMKNVPVALDMVFVNDGKIVAIAAAVPPCAADPCPTYGPPGTQLVEYVIELRAGRAEELALGIDDPVEIRWLDTPESEETRP